MLQQIHLATPPAVEPVTLAEVKAQARIEADAADALLTALISAARQASEAFTNRAYVTQTWVAWYSSDASFSRYPLIVALPKGNVQGVVSVKFYDDDNVETALSAAEYYLVGENLHILTIPGMRSSGGLRVEYVAGYGDNAASVPPSLRQAILMRVANLYASAEGQPTEVRYQAQTMAGASAPPAVLNMERPMRIWRI